MTGSGSIDLCVILGAPRSGTTWLQRLLAASPLVASPQETHLFPSYLSPQYSKWKRETERLDRVLMTASTTGQVQHRIIGLPTLLDEQDLVASQRCLVAALLRRSVATKPGARTVVEKTPSNSLCVDTIDRVCPEARFVHIVRDPRAVMASLRDAASGWGGGWAPADPTAAARMWLRHFDGARRAERFGRERYLELSYEDLRLDTGAVLGQVLQFLGLPDDPVSLVGVEKKARDAPMADVFAIAPALRARLPASDGAEPSGFHSSGRAPLNLQARRAAEIVLGDTARDLGYTAGWEPLSQRSQSVWRPGLLLAEALYRVQRGLVRRTQRSEDDAT